AQVAALSPPAALGPVIAGICRPVNPERQADQFRSLAEVLPILARQSRSVAELLPDASREHWESVVSAARSTVTDAGAAESLRLAAIGLVSVLPGGSAEDTERLGQLLSPQSPGKLQQAAIEGLSRQSGDAVAHVLLTHWGELSPTRRGEVLGVLLGRPAWTGHLLTAIEGQAILAGELETAVRQRLLEHPTVALRERAAKLLTLPGSADRKELIQRYLAEATGAGDSQQGRELFSKRCATCHRLQDLGQAIGPDLSPYSTKPFSALVTAVLDPNQAVDPRYHNYAISLDDGRVLTGMIQEEAAAGFKIAAADGKIFSVLRAEVEELKNSGRSLMPEGFEKDLSPAALADLQAWLSSLQTPPRSLPGNQPAVVAAGADGIVVLTAAKAAIYGDQITYEKEFGNIGYWHSPQDHVIWTCEIPQAGEFDVWVDGACDATAAGNLLGLSVGDATLTQKVASTGGWNQYRLVKLGCVTLPAGTHRVRVQPADHQLDGALLDLRMVALTPPGKRPPGAGGALAAAPVIPGDPASMARFLIDDAHPREQREKLIADYPQHSAAMIAVMGATMEPGTPEEYRRIPWIWR
ncbi:MAG TPA: c-type cytochrome, partial [Planctomycetaceae bacterium]|nr:c-type cytochrome [Planctomycetaceae bacterium]